MKRQGVLSNSAQDDRGVLHPRDDHHLKNLSNSVGLPSPRGVVTGWVILLSVPLHVVHFARIRVVDFAHMWVLTFTLMRDTDHSCMRIKDGFDMICVSQHPKHLKLSMGATPQPHKKILLVSKNFVFVIFSTN